jgi:predicted nucleic acid-binding protein
MGCRAVDALHVASALTLAADDFYTFDRDQAKLARAVGLRVLGS